MKFARKSPRRRRILLLSGDSYASAKRIATGVAGNSFDHERCEGYVGALAAHGFVPAIYEPTQPPKRWWR